MKNRFRVLLLGIAMSGVFYSCEDGIISTPKEETGYLSLRLEINVNRLKSTSAVITDDFKVEIYDEFGALVTEYPRYAELPSQIELPVGNYYVKIHSNNWLPAAFDNPYYEGVSEIFQILKGETKTIDVTAGLANVKVTVDYSATVQADFTDYLTVVSTGTDSLTWIGNDASEGYFEVTSLTVHSYLIFPTSGGSTDTVMVSGEVLDPQPKDHLQLTIDGSLSEGGLNNISLTVDETVNVVDVTIGGTAGVPTSFTDPRDGKVYNIVQIGDQVWMAENLNYNAPGSLDIDGVVPGFSDTYGRYYPWAVMMNGAASSNTNPSGVQGVCPPGWHVPSDAEWQQLEAFLGMSVSALGVTSAYRGTDEGGKLKETGTAHWTNPNTGATNSTGFTALPAGAIPEGGSFYGAYQNALFWTSTQGNSTLGVGRVLSYDESGIFRETNFWKGNAFSVRCVQD